VRTSSLLVRSALAVAALLAAAGCGGAGLDYGTSSISTTACTVAQMGTPALFSPTNGSTTVPTTTTTIVISVTPQSGALAESPASYDLELSSHSGATTWILGALTPYTPTSGAQAGYTYLSAAIPTADLPLSGDTVYDVTLYNIASTCTVNSFAEFTTS
jgi:hypothetical protein